MVSYDAATNCFVLSADGLSDEVKRSLIFINGSTFSINQNVWAIPARRQQVEQLLATGVPFDEEAKKVAERALQQAAFFLDYDDKTQVFELYIEQGQGKPVADAIGECRYRPSKGCYSIPDNMWSMQRLYSMIPKEQIEPSDSAKERLARFSEKVNALKTVVPKVRTIKPVPVERIPLDGYEFQGRYTPREHQVKMWWAAVNTLEVGDTGFFFFCGVGSGKSMVAINTALALKEKGLVRKVLVITPASLKFNFAEQVELHSNETANTLISYDKYKGKRRWRYTRSDVPVSKYYEGFKDHVEEPDAFFTIVNYEALVADPGRFMGKYDMAIVDEVHYIKGRNSDRTKAANKVLRTIPRRLGMTGTPVAKDPLDLWSLYNCIDPDIFPNRYSDFEDALVIKKMTPQKFPIIVDWKDEGLDWVNKKIYERAIRYATQECVDLPESTYSEVTLQVPEKLMKMYDEMKEHLVIEIGEMGDDDYRFIESPNALAALARLRQLAAGFIGYEEDGKTVYQRIDAFKVRATVELVKNVIDEEQVMIWYHHTFFKDWLVEHLKKEKIPHSVIQGGMSGLEVATVVNRFQKGFSRVLLSNLAMSEGYTATAANVALFPENVYSYREREQAEGRIRREGQTKKMLFVDIISGGTIDRRIVQAIKDKEALSERVLLQTARQW